MGELAFLGGRKRPPFAAEQSRQHRFPSCSYDAIQKQHKNKKKKKQSFSDSCHHCEINFSVGIKVRVLRVDHRFSAPSFRLASTPVDLSCFHPREKVESKTNPANHYYYALVKHVLLARLAELLHVTDIAKVVRRTIADRGHRKSIRFLNPSI